MHDLVVRDLGRARDRTLGLTDVDEPTLVTQHDPLGSPQVWDLAQVGQQEELWLLRGGDQARPGMLPPNVDALYDAFKHPAPSARRCRQGPWIPRPPGPPAGPPSYPNSKIKIHYAEPRPPPPATGQRERSGLGGQVVLIPRSSLTSGRIGEPSHTSRTPGKNSASSPQQASRSRSSVARRPFRSSNRSPTRTAALCAATVGELVTPCDRLSRDRCPAGASPPVPATGRQAWSLGARVHGRRPGPDAPHRCMSGNR
jgi:hypothetical protein